MNTKLRTSERPEESCSQTTVMKFGDFISGDRTRDYATVSWQIYHCATDKSYILKRGGHNSENTGVKTYAYIHTKYISHNVSGQRVVCSRVWSKKVNSQKDSSNHQPPYKGSSRGGTNELLLQANKLEIPIPDWS